MADDKMDLDDLLGLTDDDEKQVEASTTAAVVQDAPAPEAPKKTRAPRKPRQRDPEEVVKEPGHVPTESINPTDSTETPEQRRIRELEAEIARPTLKPTTDATGRPLPESQLDEEQRRIRDLEDRLARKRAEEADSAEATYVEPTGQGETILIHFLEDGLLVNGTATYRGQEMEFEIGGPAHEQTKNRRGESFLDIVDDIDKQWDRWGKQYIARGPWRGKRWGDISTITDEQAKVDAQAAARAEARRGRSAPVSTI